MLMFRSKRARCIAKLKKLCRNSNKVLAQGAATTATVLLVGIDDFLCRLQDNQLEMLLGIVSSTNGNGPEICGSCILLLVLAGDEPQVTVCRAYRWHDLKSGGELKRLPTCRSSADPVYVCCNPYHWSRFLHRPAAASSEGRDFMDALPNDPPPPYSSCVNPEDRAPSEAAIVCRNSSLSTHGNDPQIGWCRLAYWENGRRVGPLYHVEPAYLNVFDDVPYGANGLCLNQLARHSFSPTAMKTRKKIGLGIVVSREADGVWLYNRSAYPIFLDTAAVTTSATDCHIQQQPLRVPSEHCTRIAELSNLPKVDSVRVSFVKGWGKGYTRPEINCCPCWLEILLR